MKAKHVNTYNLIAIVENVAKLSKNICYIDILAKAYIAKEFTDMDFSEYIDENGEVDLVEIYDQVEPIWDDLIVSVVGKKTIDRVFLLIHQRYSEINSLESKLSEIMKMTLQSKEISDKVVGVQNEDSIK